MDLTQIPLSIRGRKRVQNMIEYRRQQINKLNNEIDRLDDEISRLIDKRNNMDEAMGGTDV